MIFTLHPPSYLLVTVSAIDSTYPWVEIEFGGEQTRAKLGTDILT